MVCDSTFVHSGLGQALTFTYARLAETNPTLASRIAQLLDAGAPRIVEPRVIVHVDATWHLNLLNRLAKAVTGATSATIVRLPGLTQLIRRPIQGRAPTSKKTCRMPPDWDGRLARVAESVFRRSTTQSE
jgi:hypothetical protein